MINKNFPVISKIIIVTYNWTTVISCYQVAYQTTMPEGPEIRVVADQCRAITDGKIEFAHFYGKAAKTVTEDLSGYTITTVESLGKKLVFTLNDGKSDSKSDSKNKYLIFSFGMTGQMNILLVEKEHTPYALPAIKHTQAQLQIVKHKQTTILTYSDPRGFGSIILSDHNYVLDGIDVFDLPENQYKWWNDKLFKSRKAICSVLLDQQYIPGVGNYIKSDALYLANIHPDTVVSSLTEEQLKDIGEACYKVAMRAYKDGGNTIAVYRDAYGKMGYYKPLVYKQTVTSKGEPVYRITTRDNRTSYTTIFREGYDEAKEEKDD